MAKKEKTLSELAIEAINKHKQLSELLLRIAMLSISQEGAGGNGNILNSRLSDCADADQCRALKSPEELADEVRSAIDARLRFVKIWSRTI